ncbi:hypothetical protein [Actinosynnema sp. NPDC023587]|uniref:hypothetical protein n=1 Tax=Actinosynnema sp. NPDC023587 TaxID=3154695 RepID=UPI0034031271
MSAHRNRGILRAAALLAAGAAPLLAGTGSAAAEAPLNTVEGKIGEAAQRIDAGVAKPVTELIAGQAVTLPAPVQAPVASAPQLPSSSGLVPPVAQLPGLPQLPLVPKAAPAPQAREVTAPGVAKLPGAPEIKAPTVTKPAVPGLPGGAGPVALPVLG